MYYSSAEAKVKKILEEENIRINDKFHNTLLIAMSEMYNYSEEEQRILPQIIIGTQIEAFFEMVPAKSYFRMFEDTLEGTQFLRYFKSLALFCNNGWYIYVNIKKEKMEYGIFRRYAEINGNNFEEYLHEQADLLEMSSECKILIIKSINNFELCITRPNKEDEIISIKFYEEKSNNDRIFFNVSKDVISSQPTGDKLEYAQKCMLKVLRNLPVKVHGTIMLIVDDTFIYPNDFLSGIVLEPSINFYEHFLENRTIGSYAEAEKFYAITGAFYEMLNTDGITIITEQGQVIGYNAFYEGEIPKDIKGGARKRTAEGIFQNEEIKGLVAVYFQSQDGEVDYKKKENRE
ncbi:MAG: hypothetical protein MR871_09055 [Lachnospiraceae bacterium]|nr:hypothetical protein [Lachnospiraceae bacterium]